MFVIDWRVAALLRAVALAAFATLRRAARVATEVEIALERAPADVASRAIELGQAQPVLRAAGHADGTPRMHAALAGHRDTYRDAWTARAGRSSATPASSPPGSSPYSRSWRG